MTQSALPTRGSRGRLGVAAALVLGALFSLAVWAEPGGRLTVLAVDDLGQLFAASLAAAAAARAAYRVTGSRRRAWVWIAVGMAGWASGQAVWTGYELFLGREVPFPSAADVGFLITPLATAVGLLTWLSAGRRAAGGLRDLLDGAIIAGSLLVLSWITALGSVYAAGAPDALSFSLGMAYPIGDLVTATLVLLAVARTNAGSRGPLLVLGVGLGGLAGADSAYVYLVSEGAYASGNLISSGWVTGFLLIAAAAALQSSGPDAGLASDDDRPSWVRLALPYVPLLAAVGTVAARVGVTGQISGVELGLGAGLVLLVMCRQFLVLADNHRLMVALHQREAQLAHQAFHDPLTGLANRALFLDRLEQAVSRHHRNGAGLAVLFVDLDDFKNVNDGMGHAAGDALLIEVSHRMQRALRAVDTVARLGGDEFAALLEAPHEDPSAVAQRLVGSMDVDALVEGTRVTVGASVGVAYLPYQIQTPAHGQWSVTAAQIVAAADRAMYTAKAAGKGRAYVADLSQDAGSHGSAQPTTRQPEVGGPAPAQAPAALGG